MSITQVNMSRIESQKLSYVKFQNFCSIIQITLNIKIIYTAKCIKIQNICYNNRIRKNKIIPFIKYPSNHTIATHHTKSYRNIKANRSYSCPYTKLQTKIS